MRVLHVIQELRTGGAERVVLALARGASAAGHRVAVASGPGALLDELDTEWFPLPILRRRPWLVPVAASTLGRTLRRWRPDVVHCHNPAMAAVASVATLRGRRPKALVSVHGVPEEDWAATARVLRLAALPAIACGPGVAAALAEHGVSASGTIINGVAPSPAAADRATLDREWSLPPGARLLLAVGRLVEQKNHALAIRALAHLPEAVLVVLGDGPLRGELEALAAETGVSGRVRLPGVRADARAAMAAADAVVLPSRWEGLPLVALEALTSGTPLVATAARGVRELVRDGETCLLVPLDDAVALANAVRRTADPELAARLAAAGRALASEYTEDAMVRRFLALYEELAA